MSNEYIKLSVKLHQPFSELVGSELFDLTLDESEVTVKRVLQVLLEKFPALSRYIDFGQKGGERTVRGHYVMLNSNLVTLKDLVKNGDLMRIMPVAMGGS